ncbi:hypothetical protein L1S35_03825 [Flavobacterium sp. AS60]|uniref:hypothetical protein n=1 Tax=Flavobacterium anseongense TaxID=2910677 RepID=UPI001F21514E|nr:hypothetical protein [Flavobacterium sp. AS60]MCF6128786.1 hypothetical protein [Flavobacterium sp. AS60]
MKKIFLLLLFIFSISVLSQNVEKSLVLIDIDTNLPIEDVTVYIARTKQTLLSNAEGKVTFVLNGVSTIQVAHSAYNEIKIRSTILKEKENVFYLKSNVNGLDEIIVTKQHPQRILKNIVENSINKLTIPGRLKVYSREFFKKNGTNSYYNDGLMNFQMTGKEKNVKADILIEQNRSYGLVEEDFSPDVLGYNLNDIIQNYYNFKYLEPILEPNAKKKYDFLIKAYSKNDDYYVMSITPVDPTKVMRDDFTIIYDRKKKLIVEASSFASPNTISNIKDKTSVGSKNIYKSSFKTIYRLDNTNYYLVGSKEEIGFERIDKKNSKTDIEIKSYFVITNFSAHKFTYDNSDIFKEKTLYNKKNSILTNYWDISGLTATEEEEAIIASLEFRP